MKEFFDILLSEEMAYELDNIIAVMSVIMVAGFLLFGNY